MASRLNIRITVRGRLSDRLAAAFEGMTPVRRRGATDLVGAVSDQAQLHGLLARVRDLGLELESAAVVVGEAGDGAGLPRPPEPGPA